MTSTSAQNLLKTPKVLVLLAAFNGSQWIVEQIRSVLQQQNVDVDIMVSDDKSSDDTVLAVVHAFALDSRVDVIRREHPSGSAAGNFRALIADAESADYDFIAFADQDDVWYRHKLSRACEALADGRHAAYSAAVDTGPREGAKTLVQSRRLTSADFFFEGAGQGCTFVMSQPFFQRVQGFVRDNPAELARFHFHDWMVYLLSRAWNVSWYFDPIPGMWYRQHGGNDIGARGKWPSVRKRLALITNGWYRGQVRQAVQLYALAGGRSPAAERMATLLRAPPSVGRRLRLSWTALVSSRRRVLDSVVVGLAALGGYL